MRYTLKIKNSTKQERIVYELLKELRIPFRHRWKIDRFEVDFLIGKHVIEINGHEQDGERNHILASLGYVPIHFHNDEIKQNRELIKIQLKDIYDTYKLSIRSI